MPDDIRQTIHDYQGSLAFILLYVGALNEISQVCFNSVLNATTRLAWIFVTVQLAPVNPTKKYRKIFCRIRGVSNLGLLLT